MKNTYRIGSVTEPGRVEFSEKELVQPGEGEVLIRIAASAICGSDLHIFKGKHPSVPLPVTIGHEFSGTVAAVGKNVGNVKVGDRVTVEPVLVCGTCMACRTGNYGYCENISFTYRNGDGAMADYITVEASHVYPLPDRLSSEAGALIEPLSVAVHAVRRADIQMGETVLVIGAGAIGLLIAALCRNRGAGEVIVSDFSHARLEMAEKLGATMSINPSDTDLLEKISEVTGGSGVDKAFECVGLEVTFNQVMQAVRKNGLATIVGIFEKPQISINAARFVTHEIRIQGSQGYCWDFPVALQMSKEIDLEMLVTHSFPLDELQQALETALDRGSGAIKVILKP